jgi:hypothetical protein
MRHATTGEAGARCSEAWNGRVAAKRLRNAAGTPCLPLAGEVILTLVSFVFGAPAPKTDRYQTGLIGP